MKSKHCPPVKKGTDERQQNVNLVKNKAPLAIIVTQLTEMNSLTYQIHLNNIKKI